MNNTMGRISHSRVSGCQVKFWRSNGLACDTNWPTGIHYCVIARVLERTDKISLSTNVVRSAGLTPCLREMTGWHSQHVRPARCLTLSGAVNAG